MALLLEITALSRAGAGVGRDLSGRVIFVPFTAPGDTVQVEIVAEEKRYAEGKLLEIVKPSPQRVNPPCPVFGRCGGCEWQHLPYELQWDTKKGGVLHALERVNVSAPPIFTEIPAEQIWEYRNRLQLRGFRHEIGFYGRRSKKLVPIEKCHIARPELNAWLEDVKAEGFERKREYKAELEVFPDGVVTVAWNSSHSAQGFRQVHDEQNKKLQAWVAEHLSGGPLLLDLYGGSGNLSLGIAERFQEVQCVDFSSPLQSPPHIPHFHFQRSAVLPWLEREQENLRKFPAMDLILDPPREGLGPELVPILEILNHLPVRRLLLIGCEADSWARAVSRFVRHGWSLSQAGALDFFPQTHHVEALAILEKKPSSDMAH